MNEGVAHSVLGEIAAIADAIRDPGLRADAEALAQRLSEGRFYVVCVGQFKRGKSTLLNALVGAAMLPAGVAPVTSVVTVVRYADEVAVRVRAADERWREIAPGSLRDYVSEERNPGNMKRVTGVEVFVPAPLLRHGLCLVDTPGIGSVFAANTAATRDFLPQLDAALIVVGADPPITGDELALVEEIAERVPHRLFVLAKADRLSDLEREEAIAFTKGVLAERLKHHSAAGPPILEISATEALSGRASRDWSSLVRALEELAGRAGADLVAGAERRGSADLAARLLSAIGEQIAILERPLAESESRLAALRTGLADAERALRDLAPLFAAEETRLLSTVENDRDEWFRAAVSAAQRDLETALRFARERGPALRKRAIAEAATVARRWLDDWSGREGPKIDRLFRTVMQRFVDLLAAVEKALVAAAGERDARSLAIEPALRAPSHFYMTELLATAPTSAGKQLLDLVGGASERRTDGIRRDAAEYLARLLEVNGDRLKNDFRERLASSRRALETEVRRRLADMGRTADQSLDRARTLHQKGRADVDAELARLRDLRGRAERLRHRLSALAIAANAGAS